MSNRLSVEALFQSTEIKNAVQKNFLEFFGKMFDGVEEISSALREKTEGRKDYFNARNEVGGGLTLLENQLKDCFAISERYGLTSRNNEIKDKVVALEAYIQVQRPTLFKCQSVEEEIIKHFCELIESIALAVVEEYDKNA